MKFDRLGNGLVRERTHTKMQSNRWLLISRWIKSIWKKLLQNRRAVVHFSLCLIFCIKFLVMCTHTYHSLTFTRYLTLCRIHDIFLSFHFCFFLIFIEANCTGCPFCSFHLIPFRMLLHFSHLLCRRKKIWIFDMDVKRADIDTHRPRMGRQLAR